VGSQQVVLMQGSSSGTFFLSNAHDDAHDAFMTLPAYTRTSEGEAPQLGRGPKPYQDGPWSEKMPSSKEERSNNDVRL